MKRAFYSKLLAWKNNPNRKPLLLQGARQVGKTWLINQFGTAEYQQYFYFNFEQNPALASLFSDLNPKQILHNLQLYCGKQIPSENSLICFDEIQVCPAALTSLKYFQEQASEYHIIAAGSLLGVSVGKTTSFPVGKVNFLTLYPLSFEEFLWAVGEQPLADQLLHPAALPDAIHDKLNRWLKIYLYTGGMPEALSAYLPQSNYAAAREVQNEILASYQRDFSKYSTPAQAIRLSEIWQSIPFQLAKENKKFTYSEVKSGSRASTYELSLEWLRNAGLIHVVNQIRTAKLPLTGYADASRFKIYVLDNGLLGAALKLSPELILDPNQLFAEYNGAFIENFVCTELVRQFGTDLHYWSSDREAEVDFVLQSNQQIFPVEVKSGSNTNMQSLRTFAAKFGVEHVYRFSPRNFTTAPGFTNLPLYGLPGFSTLFSE